MERFPRQRRHTHSRYTTFMIIRNEDALEYHSSPPPGKISVTATKPCHTQRDLSLAYTPGVAVPCLAGNSSLRAQSKMTGSDAPMRSWS